MLDEPTYNFSEASRYIRIPIATLRSWTIGRDYPKGESSAFFKPLIQLPSGKSRLLSFNNLVEVYVLSSLRHEHGVSIKSVRMALDYAETEFGIPRLLLSSELLTAIGTLFIERYGELIDLSLSGQLALKIVFKNHLRRIDWYNKIPIRLYPFIYVDKSKSIAIDPSIQFGRPILRRKGILTSVIADRIDSGESVHEVAKDYEINKKEVELAVRYERAA